MSLLDLFYISLKYFFLPSVALTLFKVLKQRSYRVVSLIANGFGSHPPTEEQVKHYAIVPVGTRGRNLDTTKYPTGSPLIQNMSYEDPAKYPDPNTAPSQWVTWTPTEQGDYILEKYDPYKEQRIKTEQKTASIKRQTEATYRVKGGGVAGTESGGTLGSPAVNTQIPTLLGGS